MEDGFDGALDIWAPTAHMFKLCIHNALFPEKSAPVDMFGIPMCARRASPRIRPSRLGPPSSMSSQARATSITSSLQRVRVSGRMDFIPTKTSYSFAFKWRNQACTLSELTEEAGQTRCSALGGSPSYPRVAPHRVRLRAATRQLAEYSRERIELHDVPTSARPPERWSGDAVRGRGADWLMTLDCSRCKLESVYSRILPGRKTGRRVQQCCRHSRRGRACRRSDG